MTVKRFKMDINWRIFRHTLNVLFIQSSLFEETVNWCAVNSATIFGQISNEISFFFFGRAVACVSCDDPNL